MDSIGDKTKAAIMVVATCGAIAGGVLLPVDWLIPIGIIYAALFFRFVPHQ